MNKREAKQIVYLLTARSLRRMAKDTGRWKSVKDLPKDLTPAAQGKVASEMLELADKLESKFVERAPIEGEVVK